MSQAITLRLTEDEHKKRTAAAQIKHKKLKGYTPATWRYRAGDYYTSSDRKKMVFMIAIDHCTAAY